MNIYELINELMQYGEKKGLYDPFDKDYVLNSILAVLKLDDYEQNNSVYNEKEGIVTLIDKFIEYAVSNKIIEDTQVNKDLFDTKLMGCLTPLPSIINNKFHQLKKDNPEAATNYFYNLCKDTNYIRTSRIIKDIHFDYECEYGTLNISINMSKPEKDPNDIKKLLTMKQVAYPKCMLCKENVNYQGRLNFPARQNLRFVGVTLSNKQFYMQYSPYSYFNEHTICFKEEHSNMKVDMEAVREITDFVDQFKHYFMGSNAGLPIVGGSILNHHHFQGGRAVLPMQNAKETLIKECNGVEYNQLLWPLNVIRLRSASKENILVEAEKVMNKFNSYTNEKLMIIADDENGHHNAITPICRYVNNKYELDMVLRNNIVTDDRPLGLYHPREEYWNIKKENIGLIEVMGLAILPSRLKNEMQIVKKYMLNEELNEDELNKINKHIPWAIALMNKNNVNEENVDEVINNGIGETFKNVLKDCALFKDDSLDEFTKFIKNI